MNSKLVVTILMTLILTNLSVSQVPKTMNYQGLLTEANGSLLPDGNYNLTFYIYDVASGGSSLWSETQSVEFESGIFNVILGTSVELDLAFNVPYWMGIQIAADPELSPRIELTSSAYTFNSKNAEAIGGNVVTSAPPATGQVLKWSGTAWAPDTDDSGGPPSGLASGDLSGASPGPTVTGIYGRALSDILPTTDQVLKWDGNAWTPGNDSAGSSLWEISENNLYYNQGYIGVGTANPGAGLSLHSASGYGSAIGLNNTGGGLEWRIASWTDGTLRFVKTTGNTFSPIVIEPVEGKIGIGTSAPNQQLSVHTNSGTSYIRVSDITTGTTSGLRLGMSGNGNAYIINDETAKSLSLGTGGITKMQITDFGYIGINQNTPSQMLHIKQNNTNKGLRIEHQSSADYWENGVGTISKNYKFYYNSLLRADISSVDGSYLQSSDVRLKKNIDYMEPVLDKVTQLKPANYKYIDSNDQGPKSIGFIAQEVEQLFPDLVRDTDNGYKGLVYDGFAVLAIKAIQEQQKIIEELRTRIEKLENR